jgi:hypothetical protein
MEFYSWYKDNNLFYLYCKNPTILCEPSSIHGTKITIFFIYIVKNPTILCEPQFGYNFMFF